MQVSCKHWLSTGLGERLTDYGFSFVEACAKKEILPIPRYKSEILADRDPARMIVRDVGSIHEHDDY